MYSQLIGKTIATVVESTRDMWEGPNDSPDALHITFTDGSKVRIDAVHTKHFKSYESIAAIEVTYEAS